MDVVVSLVWLAAIVAVFFVAIMWLWRQRMGIIKLLVLATAICFVIFFIGDEIAGMLVWYLKLVALAGCPGLILALVFKKRLKRQLLKLKAWWKRVGPAKAFPVAFIILFAVYLIGSKGAALLLPVAVLAVLAYIFRRQLRSGRDNLLSLVRQGTP